jgi:phosphonate transport system ATP-binding protein
VQDIGANLDLNVENNSKSYNVIVRICDAWLSYDGKAYVLNGINICVRRKMNYVIVGPSGSGKSTLLKLINGMVVPSKGLVQVLDTCPNHLDKSFKHLSSKIGYIPQSLGLVKNSSVLENVLIGALPRLGQLKSIIVGFPEYEINKAISALEMVGLSGKERRKAYMLSGGEKRRVAIARALVQEPEILLADEIVSELDHSTAIGIMELIMKTGRRLKTTSIMIHHDIELALDYADVIIMLKDGNKIGEARTDEIKQEEVLAKLGSYY